MTLVKVERFQLTLQWLGLNITKTREKLSCLLSIMLLLGLIPKELKVIVVNSNSLSGNEGPTAHIT